MDRTYIESQHIVERYLSGDLKVREAREFEKYCAENPDVLQSMPIPVRVKARMARRPGGELPSGDFDPAASQGLLHEADLDEDDNESAHSRHGMPSHSGRSAMILGVALAIALVGVAALWLQSSSLKKQLRVTQTTSKTLQLQPPSGLQEHLLKLSPTQPTNPTLSIGWPNPPQLLELRIDMSEGQYNTFQVTIDSVSEGRAMQIRRIARDSNKEIRIGLNSSAFGPGDYDIKFEGYTWRGSTVPAGWVRLGLK
jgi:hypothetical protein